MPITALPTPPQRSDSTTFAARGDAFLAALPTFATEANMLQADVNTQAAAASTATAARDVALAAANYKGLWVNLTGALNIPASVYHLGAFWALTSNLANVTTQEPGAGGVWAPANGLVPPLVKVRPTLMIDFANAQAMDPRFTFTRASTATRTNARGLKEQVLAGVPRIDFDPVTLECRGLLMEEARTNLTLFSEQYDNAAWTKAGASITANASLAPDGTVSMDKLVEDAAVGGHYTSQNVSVTSGVTYTASRFVKAGERSVACTRLESTGFSSQPTVWFDLSTGTVSQTAGSPLATSFTNEGGGIYRISVTATATATVSCRVFQLMDSNPTGTLTYTGNSTSGLFMWGEQFEAGESALSYIPTTTVSVARAADTALMNGANFTSWFRAAEGTLLLTHSVAAATVTTTQDNQSLSIDDGTIANLLALRSFTVSGVARFDASIRAASLVQADFAEATIALNTPVTHALAYRVNDCAYARNGGAAEPDTSVTLPTGLTTLRLGTLTTAGVQHYRRLAYYPARLSSAQLQALTAQ